MNSTFAIALGVPARHIEAISTARDTLLADLGANDYHQRWNSWIPVCTTPHLYSDVVEGISARIKQHLMPAIAPTRFAVRGACLVVEFEGADDYVALLQESVGRIFRAATPIQAPAYVPVLSSFSPEAIVRAQQRAADLVLPKTLLPLSDLLFYEQDGAGAWHLVEPAAHRFAA